MFTEYQTRMKRTFVPPSANIEYYDNGQQKDKVRLMRKSFNFQASRGHPYFPTKTEFGNHSHDAEKLPGSSNLLQDPHFNIRRADYSETKAYAQRNFGTFQKHSKHMQSRRQSWSYDVEDEYGGGECEDTYGGFADDYTQSEDFVDDWNYQKKQNRFYLKQHTESGDRYGNYQDEDHHANWNYKTKQNELNPMRYDNGKNSMKYDHGKDEYSEWDYQVEANQYSNDFQPPARKSSNKANYDEQCYQYAVDPNSDGGSKKVHWPVKARQISTRYRTVKTNTHKANWQQTAWQMDNTEVRTTTEEVHWPQTSWEMDNSEVKPTADEVYWPHTAWETDNRRKVKANTEKVHWPHTAWEVDNKKDKANTGKVHWPHTAWERDTSKEKANTDKVHWPHTAWERDTSKDKANTDTVHWPHTAWEVDNSKEKHDASNNAVKKYVSVTHSHPTQHLSDEYFADVFEFNSASRSLYEFLKPKVSTQVIQAALSMQKCKEIYDIVHKITSALQNVAVKLAFENDFVTAKPNETAGETDANTGFVSDGKEKGVSESENILCKYT